MPKADFERFIDESMTFVVDASKQSSSPILERPTKILDNGRSDEYGIVASNSVVGADGTIQRPVDSCGLKRLIGAQFSLESDV